MPLELPRGHRETEQKSEIYSPTKQIWEEKEGLGRILEHKIQKILKNLNQKTKEKPDIEDYSGRRAESGTKLINLLFEINHNYTIL